MSKSTTNKSKNPSSAASAEPYWVDARALQDLAAGELTTFKHAEHQLVLIRTEEDQVFALDNRCPHEGYPLAQGDLKGCALTCCWHNWKFDVHDGSCSIGGEGVRSYPTRVEDGQVQIDLSPPDAGEAIESLRASFDEGLYKGEVGRALRDAARQLQAGRPALEILWDIARHDGRNAEYGSTHVLAVAAECARLLAGYAEPSALDAGTNALYVIAPALDLDVETNRRLPVRVKPEGIPYEGDSIEQEIAQAVEIEDVVRAEALMIGAIERGATIQELDRMLLATVSLHLTNFGHHLIYLTKIWAFLEGAPPEALLDIYPSLLYATALGTRGDTLPYMQAYTQRFEKVEEELPRLASCAHPEAAFDSAALRDQALDGSTESAVNGLLDALRGGVSAERVAECLVAAAAHRLWRFNVEVDRDPLVAENWLWATHRFTFASAVRVACRRWGGVESVRLLFQLLAFVHSGRPMDRPEEQRLLPAPSSGGVDALIDAILVKDSTRAQATILGIARSSYGLGAARRAIEGLCLKDPMVRPIFLAHAFKTAVAAFDEADVLRAEEGEIALVAAVRFLSTPISERRVREEVGTTLRWVIDGKMPRKLTQ